MSGSVRSVEVTDDRTLVTVRRTLDEPAAGQVVIDVALGGICGSDLHFRDVPALFPAGTVPGHELSGRIAAVSRISMAASTKAPIAARKPGTPWLEAISAAPGVDQAVMIGMR